MIGGVIFEGVPGLDAESDGDVVYHALCNAISSLTGVAIGQITAELCRKDGITDSGVYVEKALETLQEQKLVHVAFTIEGKRPRLQERIDLVKRNISSVCGILEKQVGLTVISGDGLTDVGCGEGLQCLCVLTTVEDAEESGE